LDLRKHKGKHQPGEKPPGGFQEGAGLLLAHKKNEYLKIKGTAPQGLRNSPRLEFSTLLNWVQDPRTSQMRAMQQTR